MIDAGQEDAKVQKIDTKPNIVFIFSQPRSGSTLLQRMLSSHDEIVSVSETWLLLPQLLALKPRRVIAEYNHSIAHMAIMDFIEELDDGRADYNTCLRSFIMDLYSRTQQTTRDTVYFLEKTPRYYLIIPEIAELFPDAKFVFLFRNPLAVMSSIIESWHNGRLSFGMHYDDVFRAPQLLAEGFRLLRERAVSINFEDLVRSPKSELERITSYLELDFDERLVEGYQETVLRRMKPSERKYKGLDEKTLTVWKETFSSAYRVKFARKYIEGIGDENLDTMGIDREGLFKTLDCMEATASISPGLLDRVTRLIDVVAMTIEWPFLRRRSSQRVRGETIQQYYL